MPKNPNGPVRRGQLIAPFGVGSFVIVPGGVSLIIGGLDNWYRQKEEKRIVDLDEFRINEWRLQNLLGVSHFRLPPDYRDPYRNPGVKNVGLTVPAYRFPAWYFCSDKSCRLLMGFPMTASGKGGKLRCPECEKNKKTRYMFQVPFVCICENGHIQDFPWREWVHREASPSCQGKLRLKTSGGSTLGDQTVTCDCGKKRNLAGITNANPDRSTNLSKQLCSNGDPFFCQGEKTWLGANEGESCNAHLKGSLRSASNLYFASVISSIYLPITDDSNLQQLENALQSCPVSTIISTAQDLGENNSEKIAQSILNHYPSYVAGFDKQQISKMLEKLLKPTSTLPDTGDNIIEDARISFKRAEYDILRSERNDHYLKIKSRNLEDYDENIQQYFSRIMLVSKLRETRVLAGFTRVFAENNQNQEQRQALLWKEIPPKNERWLPANIVYGEGIFFDFSIKHLIKWESQKAVLERVAPLYKRNKEMLEKRHLHDREINPRYVLLHTFAHVLMNRLSYECGYGSAALRERIYVSTNPEAPMAGVLIYTADGDSEGTMGGLVRMGKPGNIEPIILRAIENAKWCSSDPVCMELGKSQGQGPDSCNLAACHSCALVPETACEEFNRFLDRCALIGEIDNPSLGYFNN